jgi:tetratricopeptide (TPR) repeat protein
VGGLSLALNYRFGGLEVRGYHIVNTVIHFGASLALYALILLAFATPVLRDSSLVNWARPMAFFSALIFAVHPLQTQAVTYIVQRFASMVALWYLLAVVFYAWARLTPSLARRFPAFGLSLIAVVLAMKTKENAVTLPFAVVLFEFLFFKGSTRRRVAWLAALVPTLFIAPVAYFGGGRGGGLNPIETGRRIVEASAGYLSWEYFVTQLRVIVTYIRLIFIPVGQNLDYDYPRYGSLFEAPVLASLFLLGALLVLAVYLIYRSRRSDPAWRLVSFGILWFFLTLAVESSFLRIPNVIFEHRVYLPMAGATISIVATFALFVQWAEGRWSRSAPAAVALLSVVVLVLGGATRARNEVWRDPVLLWGDATRKSPEKIRPRNNLASALLDAGRVEEAIAEYQAVLALDSEHPEAHLGLGRAYGIQGRLEEAEAAFVRASRLDPNSAKGTVELGNALAASGRLDDAIAQYRMGILAFPRHAGLRFNLGLALFRTGALEEARIELELAKDLDPAVGPISLLLGQVYEGLGFQDLALASYEAAARIRPNDAEARYRLGALLGRSGALSEAIDQLQRAEGLAPEDPRIHHDLGTAYYLVENNSAAIDHLQRSLELDPANAEANFTLYLAYGRAGDIRSAEEHLRRARELDPSIGGS